MTYSSRCLVDKCSDQEKADAHALWHRLVELGDILQKGDDMNVKAMIMSSNEKCSTLLALCEGNPTVTGEFPSQKPVTWSFDIFFDLRLNKWLNKWWFEMPPRSLWRDCNECQRYKWLHEVNDVNYLTFCVFFSVHVNDDNSNVKTLCQNGVSEYSITLERLQT